MDDYALVLNAGSSSLKFCVYQRPDDSDWEIAARGQIEGIGTSPRLRAKDAQGAVLVNNSLDAGVADGHAAIEALASWLRSKWPGARVLGVGHRVVHGGARYSQPVLLTRQTLSDLYELVPLAPLHQPYNLAAIDAVFERLPGVPQVACFDTGFHSGHSQVAELIPLPKEICKSGLQRYGFHGLSYEYIASVLPTVAPAIAKARVIVAHLGSGASLCALKDGRSVDSTLGFTALDGLCMGTRPGAIDPGSFCIFFKTSGSPPKRWRRCFTSGRVCWGSQGSATTCAICSAEANPKLVWRWITSYIARRKKSVLWPRCSAESMHSYSQRELEKIRRKSAAESARHLHGWVWTWIPRQTLAVSREYRLSKAGCRHGWFRLTRNS